MNLNRIVLSGRITADAELTHSGQGTPICKFRLAVNDRRSDKVSFINVVCFSKQAEVLNEHLLKGRLVGVDGKLSIEQYEKDGVKKDSISILADNIELGPKSSNSDN